ncbi:unnamed protein product [Alopecurus aequalis]
MVMVEDDQVWLERDEDESADAAVLRILEEGGEDQEAVLDDEEDDDDGSEDDEDEEMLAGTDQEDDDRFSDDDFGDEDGDDDEESDVSGFMRVAAVADAGNQEGGGEREILVLYRYTHFSAAWSDGSVEARGRTEERQLRFVASAGLGSRSLAWAGASLPPLIYPDGLWKPLRELWTSLASEVSLPPGASRVKVFVDVGILARADCTQASMEHMRVALKDMVAEPWSERFADMVLNLPEPVRCGRDDEEKAAQDNDKDTDGEQRPAKRRRVVADGDDCSLCFDELEGDDLAAWPGCGKPHVFHGRCMEHIIESKSKPLCPICRRGLYVEPKLMLYSSMNESAVFDFNRFM